MEAITGYKHKNNLVFVRDGKTIVYDFADMEFKRPLKKGGFKTLVGSQAFFRNLTVGDVADGFANKPYAELMRKVSNSYSHRFKNFASVFSVLPRYKHLESYLVLGIKFSGNNVFNEPVSIYNREVIAFMKESGITFTSNYWEVNYLANKALVDKVISHVRKTHYLDLEVYRMAYNIFASYNCDKFKKMVGNQASTAEFDTDWRGDKTIKNTPFGCEYKTLFDYLVMIDRTEACDFNSAMGYYYDYLSMMRKMERSKTIGIMQKTNPNLDVTTVGFVGFGRIEKYPKYLRTRHDVVAKNFRAYDEACNEIVFASAVEKGYNFKKGEYKIVTAKTSQDVRNEGTSLHHCVASYVSRILDGTTQIVFLRQTEDESLVTVEIRANAIVQARGYNNRSIDANEKAFLKVFAKAKNLNYDGVVRDETMPTPPITALVKWDTDISFLREVSALVR